VSIMPEISMSGREGSCGKCSGDGVKCSGKSYKTRNSLECLFHTLVYQIQCDRRATQSNVLVHSFVGKRHTHLIEAFHLQAHLLLRLSLKNASIHHTSLHTTVSLFHSRSKLSQEWRRSLPLRGHYTSRDTCHGKCPPPTYMHMYQCHLSPLMSQLSPSLFHQLCKCSCSLSPSDSRWFKDPHPPFLRHS